jgi:hypothetical protein
VIGYPLVVIAAGWFLYKVYLSYTSAGGTQLEMPVYDGAIYPPIMSVAGAYLVLRGYGVDWPVGIYVGLWLGLTLLTAVAIRAAEYLGDKPLT